MTDFGSFPLAGTSALPNITVAFPGEHWSDGKAQEAITPGELIVQTASASRKYWRRGAASSADASSVKAAVALRTIQIPDPNTGPGALGPNQVMDHEIAVGEWVHAYHSGSFILTLVTPGSYETGDLLGFDPSGARPAGVTGTGAWKKVASENLAFFVVEEVRQGASDSVGGTEVILTVRSRRSQF